MVKKKAFSSYHHEKKAIAGTLFKRSFFPEKNSMHGKIRAINETRTAIAGTLFNRLIFPEKN